MNTSMIGKKVTYLEIEESNDDVKLSEGVGCLVSFGLGRDMYLMATIAKGGDLNEQVSTSVEFVNPDAEARAKAEKHVKDKKEVVEAANAVLEKAVEEGRAKVNAVTVATLGEPIVLEEIVAEVNEGDVLGEVMPHV